MSPNATKKWPIPPRRRVYLMRHGEVDYFAPDGRAHHPATVPLNPEGRLQAEAAGRELATVPLDRVVTSGLRRSVETAQFALGARQLLPEVRSDLREIEPGRLLSSLNASPEEIADAFLGALDGGVTADTRFLGGETFGGLTARVWPCFEALLADKNWRHLLVVAHGVVNRVLLTRVLGSGVAGVGAIEQDAGCLNVIDVDDEGRFLVRLLNHSPLNSLKLGIELTTMERLYEQYLRTR
jgi:broad specificity phosphatase PhoE